MLSSGLCHVEGDYYTKTIAFEDTNFQMAGQHEKRRIFGQWCQLLNSFSEDVSLQLTYMNYYPDLQEIETAVKLQGKDDRFQNIRKEFYTMLRQKLADAGKGLVKRKYATFGIHAKNIKDASNRLNRIEREMLSIFKALRVTAYPLDGQERLKLLHKQLNPHPKDRFVLPSNRKTNATGFPLDNNIHATTKDYISPQSFRFQADTFVLEAKSSYSNKPAQPIGNKTLCAMSYLEISAEELPDKFLSKLLDTDYPIIITQHIKPMDKSTAIKYGKAKLSEVNATKSAGQKKAFRENYDADILPPDIKMYSEAATGLIKDLQGNEELFDTHFIVMHLASNPPDLDGRIASTKSIASQYSCKLHGLEYLQEQGLASSLALGVNQIPSPLSRKLITSAVAAFMPFSSQELFQEDAEAIYYGTNAISGRVILANRKKLKNPNGVVLGIPGSGKSFFVKREFVHVFLATGDTILILDPEGEYSALVKKLRGTVVKLSTASKTHINPMDIVLDYGTKEEPNDPIGLKSEFIASMMETITTRPNGLEDVEQSIIDHCVVVVYREYLKNPIPENMPILEDLYNALINETDPENPENSNWKEKSQNLAHALYRFVKGSYTMFNHQTNIDADNRLICFDTKSLGESMRPLAMLIIQDQIWSRVSRNRNLGIGTWTYSDEFHLLIRHKQTASYSAEMYKRFRKWGAIPTVITQNVKEFLLSAEVANILENCEFVALLDQAPDDGKILAERFNISPGHLAHVTNAEQGDVLIKYGNNIIAAKDKFPEDTELYKVMTTKPSDLHGSTHSTNFTNPIGSINSIKLAKNKEAIKTSQVSKTNKVNETKEAKEVASQ